MPKLTIEFREDIKPEELRRYEDCLGVAGAFAYKNIVTLYYKTKISQQEVADLARTLRKHIREGVETISVPFGSQEDMTRQLVEQLY